MIGMVDANLPRNHFSVVIGFIMKNAGFGFILTF